MIVSNATIQLRQGAPRRGRLANTPNVKYLCAQAQIPHRYPTEGQDADENQYPLDASPQLTIKLTVTALQKVWTTRPPAYSLLLMERLQASFW